MSNSITGNELAYKDIYEQYVDEASFLWLMHTIAVDQPHYTINDLSNIERRIEAQLSGLMTNIEMSWPICEQALELESGGEVFTAAILAFRSHDQSRIQKVVDAGTVSDDCFKGLVYALAWLPGNLVHDWIKRFFTSKDINHKYLAVQVCKSRSENPSDYLRKIFQREDCLQHIKLYSSSLQITGALKRYDLIDHVNKAIENEDETVKFWAIWAAILLGDKQQVYKLEPYVFNSGELQKEAIQIAFRVLSVSDSRKWVSELIKNPEQLRNIIIITGVIGDPHAIDWLLLRMQENQFARVAAETFSMITGIDLVTMQMTQQAPEHIDTLPNEDPDDENVKMHDDENLPWPNAGIINSYWNSIKDNYTEGTRYLLGNPVEPDFLKNNLNSAFQRQRHAIALEIALLDKNEMLFNTRSKVGGKQIV
jgi:uncharacterized protein (TIGR02270 family)